MPRRCCPTRAGQTSDATDPTHLTVHETPVPRPPRRSAPWGSTPAPAVASPTRIRQTCGVSCTPCEAPTDGTATCDGKSCGGSCLAGKQLCHGACIDATAPCAGGCAPGPARLRQPLSLRRWTSRPAAHRAWLARFRPARPRPAATAPNATSPAPPAITSAAPVAPWTTTRPRAGWRASPARPIRTARRSAWAETAAWRARPAITSAATNASATATWAAAAPRRAPPVRSRRAASATCDGTACIPNCPSGMKLCAGICIDGAASCAGVCFRRHP